MSKVVFNITGFSQFGSVSANPTEVLVNRLAKLIAKPAVSSEPLFTSKDPEIDTGIRFSSIKALEVSAQVVAHHLDDLTKVEPSNDELFTVNLHLGVIGSSTTPQIHLEQWTYNLADFRIPDQRSLQLQNQPVVIADNIIFQDLPQKYKEETKDLTHLAHASRLPAIAISGVLNKKGFRTIATNDPGEYLCNYIYYASLTRAFCATTIESLEAKACMEKMSEASQSPKSTSFFIHVPPFNVISEDEQFATLCSFINAAAECVRGSYDTELCEVGTSHDLSLLEENLYGVKSPVSLVNFDEEKLSDHLMMPRSTRISGL